MPRRNRTEYLLQYLRISSVAFDATVFAWRCLSYPERGYRWKFHRGRNAWRVEAEDKTFSRSGCRFCWQNIHLSQSAGLACMQLVPDNLVAHSKRWFLSCSSDPIPANSNTITATKATTNDTPYPQSPQPGASSRRTSLLMPRKWSSGKCCSASSPWLARRRRDRDSSLSAEPSCAKQRRRGTQKRPSFCLSSRRRSGASTG